MRKTFSTRKSSISNFTMSPFAKTGLLFASFLLLTNLGMTQDLASGQAAITEAADGISGYFDPIRNIIFIIAGIIALLGAIRTYMKWNMGDPDVMSSAAAWFGSAVFLIVAVSVIQSFFGIG